MEPIPGFIVRFEHTWAKVKSKPRRGVVLKYNPETERVLLAPGQSHECDYGVRVLVPDDFPGPDDDEAKAE